MPHFYTEQQNEPKRLGYRNKVISSYVIITMNANLPEWLRWALQGASTALWAERRGKLNFHGFQKVTLLDYPGKVASTVFLGGCNFRCPFCHNGTLVTNPNRYQTISDVEVLSHLYEKRKILDGICITGGEPLLYNVEPFLREVKQIGLLVKLDHNGTQPDKLQKLISANLVDYVAIDIKNSRQKYAQTVGVANFDLTPIQRTIDLLRDGAVDYEFRTTVVKGLHDADDFPDIGKMIEGAKRYYLQQYVDSGDILHSNHFTSYTQMEMQQFADIIKPYVPNVQIRGI